MATAEEIDREDWKAIYDKGSSWFASSGVGLLSLVQAFNVQTSVKIEVLYGIVLIGWVAHVCAPYFPYKTPVNVVCVVVGAICHAFLLSVALGHNLWPEKQMVYGLISSTVVLLLFSRNYIGRFLVYIWGRLLVFNLMKAKMTVGWQSVKDAAVLVTNVCIGLLKLLVLLLIRVCKDCWVVVVRAYDAIVNVGRADERVRGPPDV